MTAGPSQPHRPVDPDRPVPVLILLAALAGLFGTKSLADEASVLIFDAWPREVAKPIVNEVHRV